MGKQPRSCNLQRKAISKVRRNVNLLLLGALQGKRYGETIGLRRERAAEEAGMTTRPHRPVLPFMFARGHAGRPTGNGAVPDTNPRPREAACRKDLALV
ncbi:hypothetical protein FHU36_003107 [Nonomuraea muscovyensis]|uniref:Uncharacterized protein n=1 Tax=Nonomuraea muscovyensis TaxID=1124761 RepID=A0A7X0C1T1_9ACTN|nr:hypothetical protein [Nonomuraea muscovyensis]